MPFEWAYHKAEKFDSLFDKSTAAVGNVLDFFGGNSSILVYLGIGLVAIIVVPKLLDKVL